MTMFLYLRDYIGVIRRTCKSRIACRIQCSESSCACSFTEDMMNLAPYMTRMREMQYYSWQRE